MRVVGNRALDGPRSWSSRPNTVRSSTAWTGPDRRTERPGFRVRRSGRGERAERGGEIAVRPQQPMPATSGVDAGTIAARNPSRARLGEPARACGTWRTSPPSPISPIATVSVGDGAVVARAGDRERDREIGARLGDAHAAGDARVDVERRRAPTPARSCSTASSIASRPPSSACATRRGHRRVRLRRRAPAPRRTADAPFDHRGDHRARRAAAPVGEEQRARVGDAEQPVPGHLHQAELVGRAEPVLQRAQHAQRVVAVALERQARCRRRARARAGPASAPSLVT